MKIKRNMGHTFFVIGEAAYAIADDQLTEENLKKAAIFLSGETGGKINWTMLKEKLES